MCFFCNVWPIHFSFFVLIWVVIFSSWVFASNVLVADGVRPSYPKDATKAAICEGLDFCLDFLRYSLSFGSIHQERFYICKVGFYSTVNRCPLVHVCDFE